MPLGNNVFVCPRTKKTLLLSATSTQIMPHSCTYQNWNITLHLKHIGPRKQHYQWWYYIWNGLLMFNTNKLHWQSTLKSVEIKNKSIWLISTYWFDNPTAPLHTVIPGRDRNNKSHGVFVDGSFIDVVQLILKTQQSLHLLEVSYIGEKGGILTIKLR